jgi:SAM-dependent methyltransferase
METLESVRRSERERLFPSLTNPSWLVLRRRGEIFRTWASRLNAQTLDVLDVGGRMQPYRSLFTGRIGRYVAIDLLQTPLVNVVARGENIPFVSGMFDLVICTQVLEYVPDPDAVIAEIHRVLKPGGYLFLSVPSIALRDADEECWRFFPSSLRRLLSRFGESEIRSEGGSVVGFFRMLNTGLDVLVRYPFLRTIFHWTLCPLINLTGEILNLVAFSKNDQLTTNYSAWARK